jgi:broad specificity phosphatase PhoE
VREREGERKSALMVCCGRHPAHVIQFWHRPLKSCVHALFCALTKNFWILLVQIKGAVRALLAECGEGEAALAVTHSSYLRIALSICLGWTLERSKAQKVDNCGVSAPPNMFSRHF